VFKGKRDYNVVFAKGISEEQAQQFVDALSDFYVYPQKPPQGSNNRYQFLISSSSTNPISNSATESRITKRICRANKLNELNIKKEGTEEYILYKSINDKSCAKSIYEAYIKDSGDDALCTYWETNKLIDTPKIEKEGKKVMRNNRRRVNEKNMMLRGRRVTENYGLGMSLNLLKDMTGIADTDELLAKIDEFILFNDCDPIFDESCRDQFVDYCNNGGDDFGGNDFGCEECGDFGGDDFGGELSDEDFDNFGEEDGEGEEPTFDEAIDLGDFDFDDDDEIVEDEGDDIETGLGDEDEGEEEEEEPEEDEDKEEKKEESYRRRSNRSRKNEWFTPYDTGKRISDYARTHRDEFRDVLTDEEYDSLRNDDELSDEEFDNFGLDNECPECRREINPIPPVFAKESCGKKKPTKKGGKKSVKESKYHWTTGARQIGNTDIYFIWHGEWRNPEYAWVHMDDDSGEQVVDWYNGTDVDSYIYDDREDEYNATDDDYVCAVYDMCPDYRTDTYGKEIGTFDYNCNFVPNDDDDYFESYKRHR